MNEFKETSSAENHPSELPSFSSGESHSRQGVTSSLFWAAMLIMAGVVFLAANLGILPQIGTADPWLWVLLGAGGLLITFSFIQAISPDISGPSGFWTIAGVAMVGYAAVNILGLEFEIENWWPLILIIIGGGSLLKALARR